MAKNGDNEEKDKVKKKLLNILDASRKNDRNAVSSYYAPDAEVFFDITDQVELNLSQMLAEGTASSDADYEIVPNNDERIHVSGDTAWVTATGSARPTKGGGASLEWRYTGILEKRRGDWLIIHEHTSTPGMGTSQSGN